MDGLSGRETDHGAYESPVEDDGAVSTPEIGIDERRMHVRAYNYWVSLLQGRPYPSIEDLDPENLADFGEHSVLLDFTAGIEDPTIAFLGRALREECALDIGVVRIAEVPTRSLLSRLTDHYLQIIANRSPIGFEAEFVGTRGHNTLYRGILMPFTSTGDTIDFIYGVINWKELVDASTQAALAAELDAAVKAAPRSVPSGPIWADGPAKEGARPTVVATGLADRLALARETAAAARAADTRSRAALYRALGRAYDFSIAAREDADGYRKLLDEAGIIVQPRAPHTPIVKLIFGIDHDKTRVTEFACVLAHAERHDVQAGGLADLLETIEGGIKGVVAAERSLRRPSMEASKPARPVRDRSKAPALASVALATGARRGELIVLLARAGEGDELEVIASIADAGLTRRVVRASQAG